MKIGDLVRFAHEKNGGPVHRIVSVMADGMVELDDLGGYFAPHLLVAADDIADIPPSPAPIASITPALLIEWADRIDSRLGPIPGRDADTVARVLRKAAERITVLNDVLGEIEAECDDEIYQQQKAHDFNAPDDAEYSATITAGLWRRVGRTLQ
jgi:hypothetical protein